MPVLGIIELVLTIIVPVLGIIKPVLAIIKQNSQLYEKSTYFVRISFTYSKAGSLCSNLTCEIIEAQCRNRNSHLMEVIKKCQTTPQLMIQLKCTLC